MGKSGANQGSTAKNGNQIPSADKRLESKTRILVALIGAVALVIGAIIGANYFLPKDPGLKERALITSFDSIGKSFSPNKLYTLSGHDNCLFVVKSGVPEKSFGNQFEGYLQISNKTSQDRQICPLVLANDLPYSDLGYVEAQFGKEKELSSTDAAAYITMFTFIDDVNLQVDCGITNKAGHLYAYFYIAAIVPPGVLNCPDGEIEGDDVRCDIHYNRFKEVNPGEYHNIRLAADKTSPGLFRCMLTTRGEIPIEDRYFIDTKGLFNIEDISNQVFRRQIEADIAPENSAIFYLDEIYEGP